MVPQAHRDEVPDRVREKLADGRDEDHLLELLPDPVLDEARSGLDRLCVGRDGERKGDDIRGREEPFAAGGDEGDLEVRGEERGLGRSEPVGDGDAERRADGASEHRMSGAEGGDARTGSPLSRWT